MTVATIYAYYTASLGSGGEGDAEGWPDGGCIDRFATFAGAWNPVSNIYQLSDGGEHFVSVANAFGEFTTVNHTGEQGPVGSCQIRDRYFVNKAFLFFDTSAFAGLTIVSAILYLTPYIIYAPGDSVVIQNGQPTYPLFPIDEAGNFTPSNYSGNGGSIGADSLVEEEYTAITLTDLSWLNLSGDTKLCLRLASDINGVTPTVVNQVVFYSETDALRPYLEITYTTAGVRSYTVRQNDRRGKPIFLAECKAINMTTGALIDTKYTDNGIAVFTTLPNDAPVDVEVRWGKQYRLYQNVYESAGSSIETMVAVSHTRNTDLYTKGVQVTTEPATPAVGRWYIG